MCEGTGVWAYRDSSRSWVAARSAWAALLWTAIASVSVFFWATLGLCGPSSGPGRETLDLTLGGESVRPIILKPISSSVRLVSCRVMSCRARAGGHGMVSQARRESVLHACRYVRWSLHRSRSGRPLVAMGPVAAL